MQIKNRKTNNKGITLIALVITIIVLLILAGVAIATLTGDNGVLTKAAKAKQETQKATEDELRRLTMLKAISNIENTTYTETNGDKATIPAGFAVSQVEGENTVQNGLVIIDANGNEFVWIPVPTAIAESEEQGTINKAMAVNLGTEENPQYRGLLYNFTDTDSTVKSGCTTTTSEFREPDIVSNYDNDEQTYLNDIGLTQSSFQAEMQQAYNDMIKSVDLNHGFYVARYEMSLDANKNAQSKKNVTSTDAAQTDTNRWYGLYDKAKNYGLKIDTTKNVVSSMIWGSQYDAMMNWMHKDSNVNVNSTTPVTDAVRNQDTQRRTGFVETDKIKNVYDLLGNSYEWTLEAYHYSSRVYRGGYYGNSSSPAIRYSDYPYYTYSYNSSRLTLYIK